MKSLKFIYFIYFRGEALNMRLGTKGLTLP